MAEPPHRGLRATCSCGLTRPEPVRTPTAPGGHPDPVPEPGTQGKPHSRRAQDTCARIHLENSSRRNQAGNGLPQLIGGSRLSSRSCMYILIWRA